MSTSLIPERPLLISPTLAATIGLDEAVLLHVLSELLLQHPATYRQNRRWAQISQETLLQALPFWDTQRIEQVLQSVQNLGLVLHEPSQGNSQTYALAINQTSNTPAAEAPVAAPPRTPAPAVAPAPVAAPARPRAAGVQAGTGGVATLIPPNWFPDRSLIQQCQQRNVPPDFVEQEVPAFVMYWRERGKVQYSWHHTFLSWIVTRWEKQRAFSGSKLLESNMSANWLPSDDALSILEHAGVSLAFIEDAIPEFILYWREKGITTSEWNSKFIAHVRRQWVRYTHTLENDTTPRVLPKDFQPDPACFDVLAMANIDSDFAQAQLPEFILYWQDRNEIHPSWNTKFLQHVKYRWAQQMQDTQPILDKLTDRSWAD